MKERPILFSAPMVRALLDGQKTQTRRLVKLPEGVDFDGHNGTVVRGSKQNEPTGTRVIRCPYGAPGDRLWVRETWEPYPLDPPRPGIEMRVEHGKCRPIYAADCLPNAGPLNRWRPSIHMPRWASRLSLDVTSVRVERLQDISEEDARAEGVESFRERFACMPEQTLTSGERAFDRPYRSGFAVLWDEINGDRGNAFIWKSNPLVWVLGLSRVIASEVAA